MFPPTGPSWIEILQELWVPGLWVLLASLILALMATPIFRALALRWGICDRPDQAVKIHALPIPYLGGCAIWLAWTAPVLLYGMVGEAVDWRALGALLAGGLVAFATGLVDDLKEIRPRYKLRPPWPVDACDRCRSVRHQRGAGGGGVARPLHPRSLRECHLPGGRCAAAAAGLAAWVSPHDGRGERCCRSLRRPATKGMTAPLADEHTASV